MRSAACLHRQRPRVAVGAAVQPLRLTAAGMLPEAEFILLSMF